MEKATIRNLKEIKDKRVFIRVDHNVPQDDKGNITDDTRIRESLDTIKYCLDKGAKIILCTHLGRPKSKADTQFTVKPIVKKLQDCLKGVNITLVDDCIGKKVEDAVSKLKSGEIVYLENIRFYPEETANDPEFSKKLAALCDYYVNDAFGAAHRAHASTEGIAKYVPAVAGFLMEREVKILGEAVANPKRPLTIIFGGKKIKDKIGVMDNLLKIADNILVGGGMTYTFVKASGGQIGNSIVDAENVEYCKNVIKTAKAKKVNLVVASDCVAADKYAPDANTRVFATNEIRDGWEGLDIGPKTRAAFISVIQKSKTVIWCGPLGVTEFDKFAQGSKEIGNAMANCKAITIAGGGDTAFTVAKFGWADKFTHLSTGGGASLELLEGKTLPGVAALLNIKEVR
ncbi:MAG: phosphoglycerate kinase [Christensenellaceae bacterium]|jgi:phosphoglycerate kinase|nr:phosphoglycerate kinase [Christensenellaceae bacterium]